VLKNWSVSIQEARASLLAQLIVLPDACPNVKLHKRTLAAGAIEQVVVVEVDPKAVRTLLPLVVEVQDGGVGEVVLSGKRKPQPGFLGPDGGQTTAQGESNEQMA
jgi:hypothetical protein